MSQLVALESQGFRRYLFGSIPSVGATQLLFVALGWLVFRLSGSPFDLGLVGVAFSVPNILVTVFGAVIADRFDRRRLIYLSSLINAVLMAAIVVLEVSGVIAVWHVLVITAISGALSGVDWPARQAIFPTLIPHSAMASAVGLFAMLWQGSRMIVPAFAGFMMGLWGTPSVFTLGALGFASMCLVIRGLPEGRSEGKRSDAHDGWMGGLVFVAQTQPFATLIPLTYVVTLFGMSYLQIMPAFVDRMQLGEEAFGLLLSASGVGSLVGTLLFGTRPVAARFGVVLCRYVVYAAAPLALFGVVNLYAADAGWAFLASLVLIFSTHVFLSAFLVVGMTVLQQRVPDELRARVMGLHGIAFSLMTLGAIFHGAVAEVTSPPVAIFLGCAVFTLAAAFAWRILARVD